MFNRIARLWGRKPEAEQGPEATATDRAARRAKGETVAESLERYRQQRAEEDRQAKEAYTREAEARYGPSATWPRLSETLEGPTHPRFCQSCGAERPPEPPDETVDTVEGDKGDQTFQFVMRELRPPPGVYGWQEHDGRDEPEPIAVMLCTACSNRLIDPHPRVYVRISRRAPFPGIMDLCIDCRYRAGVTCTHPDRLANGGPGLHIDAAPGMPGHARGHGSFTTYAYLPRACVGQSVSDKEGT